MLQRAERKRTGWHENPRLVPFTCTRTILLTTYRRDGTPVSTPVSIAFEEECACFRTWHSSGKAKRLRRYSTVEIAPATFGGKQTGHAICARTRLLTGSQARQAKRALARRHALLQGLLVPLAHRLTGYRTLHYELMSEID